MEPIPNEIEQALSVIRSKKALMISGGGTLGIALVGSLERLDELGLPLSQIETVKGSSVGSIVATAIACGASIDYMKQKIGDMKLSNFKDRDLIFCSLWQLITKYGLNKTEPIRRFAANILDELVGNSDITFAQLYLRTGVHLIITYLSMNLETTVYADYITEPHSSVRETIVKSSSIPVFYEGYTSNPIDNIKKRIFAKKCKKVLDVDGGTLDNYSFNYIRDFVSNKDLLGLKFVSEGDEKDDTNVGDEQAVVINRGYPKNVIDYLTRLIFLMREQAMKLHVKKQDWMSSLKINIGHYTSTDFDLTLEEIEWLFQQGRRGTDGYIEELAELISTGQYTSHL